MSKKVQTAYYNIRITTLGKGSRTGRRLERQLPRGGKAAPKGKR